MTMRFAFADPPYLGCGKLHVAHYPDALAWDDPATHRLLIERLCDEYPDGWALCLHEPSLRTIQAMCPADARVAPWVKPFCSFKPNVTRAYSWEPVIFRGGRPIPKDAPTWRDHISASIPLRKGLVYAKPPAFCSWVLDGLYWQPGDALDELFPRTTTMAEAIAWRLGSRHRDTPLFAEAPDAA